jgi:hypothetical protein
MNLNYAQRVKEDLDKLLDTHFIFPMETAQWLSLVVIIPKKWQITHLCGLSEVEFTNQ